LKLYTLGKKIEHCETSKTITNPFERSQLINDSSLLDIDFLPPKDTIKKKETSQTKNQIKKTWQRL
jgi:hypothetical protein